MVILSRRNCSFSLNPGTTRFSQAQNFVMSQPQPTLFAVPAAQIRAENDLSQSTEDERRAEGKNLLKELYRIRQNMTQIQREEFGGELGVLIDAVAIRSRLTDAQREEYVLYAIEQSQAGTAREVADDCRLDLKAVKKILDGLESRGIVYQVKRYVPGSDRQYLLYKSNRFRTPEVLQGHFSN